MRLILTLSLLVGGISAHAETKQEIIRHITATARLAGIDPDLAVAIATVESSLNPRAVGALGEVGLFQLRPEYHHVVVGNARHNVLVGVAYLVELKTSVSARYGSAWFVAFNSGPHRNLKNPRATKYYRRVMKAVNDLKVRRYLVSKQ